MIVFHCLIMSRRIKNSNKEDRTSTKLEYNLELIGAMYVCFKASTGEYMDFVRRVLNDKVASRLLEQRINDSGLPIGVALGQLESLFGLFKEGQ